MNYTIIIQFPAGPEIVIDRRLISADIHSEVSAIIEQEYPEWESVSYRRADEISEPKSEEI